MLGLKWDDIYHRLHRRRGRGLRAVRRDGAVHARHLPQRLPGRAGDRVRRGVGPIPGSRHRRHRHRRLRARLPAGAVPQSGRDRARRRSWRSCRTRARPAGPESIREALDLGAHRIRHGIRAVDDPDLLAEIVERRIVLDVAPISNLRTGVVKSLDEHPLPRWSRPARCVRSTPTIRRCSTPISVRTMRPPQKLGVTAEAAYRAGLAGALIDDATRDRSAALAAD